MAMPILWLSSPPTGCKGFFQIGELQITLSSGHEGHQQEH
jgi:hypothetical protein